MRRRAAAAAGNKGAGAKQRREGQKAREEVKDFGKADAARSRQRERSKGKEKRKDEDFEESSSEEEEEEDLEELEDEDEDEAAGLDDKAAESSSAKRRSRSLPDAADAAAMAKRPRATQLRRDGGNGASGISSHATSSSSSSRVAASNEGMTMRSADGFKNGSLGDRAVTCDKQGRGLGGRARKPRGVSDSMTRRSRRDGEDEDEDEDEGATGDSGRYTRGRGGGDRWWKEGIEKEKLQIKRSKAERDAKRFEMEVEEYAMRRAELEYQRRRRRWARCWAVVGVLISVLALALKTAAAVPMLPFILAYGVLSLECCRDFLWRSGWFCWILTFTAWLIATAGYLFFLFQEAVALIPQEQQEQLHRLMA